MRGPVAACLLIAAFRTAAAQAPDEIRVEAGVAEVRQAGTRSRNAALLGLTWRRTHERVVTTASGSMTAARDSIDTAQGLLAIRYQFARQPHWRVESGIAGALFGLNSLSSGGNGATFLRVQHAYGPRGVWAGTAAGVTNRTGTNLQSSAYDVGAWGEYGRTSGTVAGVVTRSRDTDLLAASSLPSRRPVGPYIVRDATVTVQQSFAALDLAAVGTLRRGEGVATKVNDRAMMLAAAFYLSPVIALTVSGGRQLADPLRALPDAKFLSASVRVLFLRRDPAVLQIDRYGAIVLMRGDPDGGATMTIRVLANASARVEAYGSFSAWQPVRMQWVLDAWELQVHVPPGPQRVAVRINGSEWRAPANLTKVTDEFGGEAGLVVVP
ncbi:MAG: glycogen-binding domain-containing protein [Gemmatimonadota bacterium]|nr:glycogen-binding domain-containing protein [Gemmatimonadota bacterium]